VSEAIACDFRNEPRIVETEYRSHDS
jgi:hypothetical protein